jgi:4-amino-4-deoxy-L-arabinose transferase-like glycosyltransferase
MKKFPSLKIYLAVIVFFSILGGLIAFFCTANGPWGYSDPVAYISTARSIDNGQGLGYYEADGDFTQFTIQPPFYSIVISILGLFKVNLVRGVRWLNIFAFMASIFISGWIFYRYSRVPAMGIVASALMLTFPYMVVMFGSAYSEPLFILLILSAAWCLFAYLQKEKLYIFIISALVVGMIPLTRYAGVAMIVAAGLSVFFFSSGKSWPRLRKAALYVLIASLPIILWLAWVYVSHYHTIGGRKLEMNWSALAAKFQTFRGIFMDTVWLWVPFQTSTTFLRYRLRFALMGIGIIIMVVLSLLAVRRLKKDSIEGTDRSGMQLFAFFGMASLTFLGVVIATYLFTSPTIDIDNRMLLPFFVTTLMALLGGFALWEFAWFKRWMGVLRLIPWLIAVVCILWYYPQTRQKVKYYSAGEGYTAYHWDSSELIQAVRDLPSDQPVIANDWGILLLWTGRPIYGFWNTLPSKPIQTTMYGTDSRDKMQSVFCEQKAALVIINDDDFSSQSPNLFQGLTVYGEYPDGMIYLCP